MQLVQGNFTEFNITSQMFRLFNIGEIFIKDNDNKLYARKYSYKGYGCAEINDRLLPILYKEEIIDKKKFIKFILT